MAKCKIILKYRFKSNKFYFHWQVPIINKVSIFCLGLDKRYLPIFIIFYLGALRYLS